MWEPYANFYHFSSLHLPNSIPNRTKLDRTSLRLVLASIELRPVIYRRQPHDFKTRLLGRDSHIYIRNDFVSLSN